MSGQKKPCRYCFPKSKRQVPNMTDCRDVAEIIDALTFEDTVGRSGKRTRPPKFKTKPFKPRHYKDTCVPMVPSMHTRLRYIGHCAKGPPEKIPDKCGVKCRFAMGYVSPSSSSEENLLQTDNKKNKFRKRVRYYDMMPGDIMLPTPVPLIKHTDSDKSIVHVASPKTSGEVVQAQRASVKPVEMRPPLPAKSGHELFKPHSGLVINRDKDFVPDVVHVPGPKKVPGDQTLPCYKGGPCKRKKCKGRPAEKSMTKKQRKQAALKRKRLEKRAVLRQQRLSQSQSEVPYSNAGATDGKPRARSTKKHIQDDGTICGLDEIPRPEHAQIPANLKKGMMQTHSLTILPCTKERKPGIHYGILTGSFNMYDSKFGPRSRGRQALTMSVMAYCLAFHYHPKQWTMKLLDNLVDAGDKWYLQCLDKVHDHSAVQGICEVLPFGKKQTLVLNAKKMQVLLAEPEIVGYTMSLDPMVYNLCRGLKAFFKDNRAGILLSRVLKVVIWRDKVCYFIFDPAGRDSRAYSNFDKGRAALMNVKDLESVAEVLLARTILEDQKFVLAPVKVLRMVDEKADEDFESDKELTQAEKAMMGYRILNENCAIVNANMHLGDRCFEEAKFRQALPVAVAAMTYAKISPPNTWFTKTLDKVLRLGNKLYMDCVNPKVMIDISIDNIPNQIIIGPYACDIIIYRERVKGQLFTTKECLLNIRTGLEEFFSHEYNSGILDFNNYVLAVWRQKDMYYLFDPYPRANDGQRTAKIGRACCWMFLNTDTMAQVFTKNWDYLPTTTQFYIHAFKVLKLKKRERKTQLVCTLSDEQLPGNKGKFGRTELVMSQAQGDGRDLILREVLPDITLEGRPPVHQPDEEQMGDIVSLVDSIQDDYLPPIPLRYKNMKPEPLEMKVANLDSPTVSVTQVIPPWPKPRDKTNEPPEPDPDPEPTPPPTPPPPMPAEGAEEEEEEAEEEEDEETIARKKEEEARRKAEEEEARRKAEELPPAMPPPPPSPSPSEPELPLAPPQPTEEEVQELPPPPIVVDRRVLLTEDARARFKLRQLRKKVTPPLNEAQLGVTASEELAKPHNFHQLPDGTEIIRGSSAVTDSDSTDVLPFAAIMAIVTSYKYMISTWGPGIVNFIVDAAGKMYKNKQERFQLAPIHIIPKIAIGSQAYQANIDVVGEGPTWQLEEVLTKKFLSKYDRGMITTTNYSCAFFKRNNLYYLYDASSCNPMGLREEKGGKACLLRFRLLHDLVARVSYNKDGKTDDQQFILSRIVVRRLLKEPRTQLPEDYDYEKRAGKSKKSKATIISEKDRKSSSISAEEAKSQTTVGYQQIEGVYRIEGTTSLKGRNPSSDMKACHFVCLMAMLMATMHPIRIWNQIMVDTCIEKGLEIYEKAINLNVCEKRVVKNVLLDGKFINVNIKKIKVINENDEKTLEQYLKAVMRRLRYVIVSFPPCSLVVCQVEGYYHLFDPYPPPSKDPAKEENTNVKIEKHDRKAADVATWTLYRSLDPLLRRIKKSVGPNSDSPEFYTFELTSMKTAPRHSALNYRLSPLFRPDENPNAPYLKRRKIRPTVDEKMYWLNIETIPWSRMNPCNDLGFERRTPKTLWKDWDIEFPGDLYSLWGSLHPMDTKFSENNRGKQYLATCVVAIVMATTCNLSAWTGSYLDGIVNAGDRYHTKCLSKFGNKPNYEIVIEDMETSFDGMYPYKFQVKFEKIIFGFVYNMFPDRFNLSKALTYFFEKHKLGILISPTKNLAFGRVPKTASYFMYDCQSHGSPIFCPGQGASYMLKCESLNRLIYCMTLTLNVRRHGQQFHLYKVEVNVSEKSK